MSFVLAVFFRPLVALAFLAAPCALGLWLVRKMDDGPLKRLLLTHVGGDRRPGAIQKTNQGVPDNV